MKILAIDYGDVRTGLAISDETNTICGEAWVIAEKSPEGVSKRIATEAFARGVVRLVLGLPKNMDGSEGPRAEKSRRLAELLTEDFGAAPVLWDERLSSVAAHDILSANGKKAKDHKATVDAVAASLILESYMGSLKKI